MASYRSGGSQGVTAQLQGVQSEGLGGQFDGAALASLPVAFPTVSEAPRSKVNTKRSAEKEADLLCMLHAAAAMATERGVGLP